MHMHFGHPGNFGYESWPRIHPTVGYSWSTANLREPGCKYNLTWPANNHKAMGAYSLYPMFPYHPGFSEASSVTVFSKSVLGRPTACGGHTAVFTNDACQSRVDYTVGQPIQQVMRGYNGLCSSATAGYVSTAAATYTACSEASYAHQSSYPFGVFNNMHTRGGHFRYF